MLTMQNEMLSRNWVNVLATNVSRSEVSPKKTLVFFQWKTMFVVSMNYGPGPEESCVCVQSSPAEFLEIKFTG